MLLGTVRSLALDDERLRRLLLDLLHVPLLTDGDHLESTHDLLLELSPLDD